MEARTVEVGRGLSWLACGWRNFTASPGMWIALCVLLIVISAVVSSIPMLGGLALSLFGPALGGGLLYAAREADQGRALKAAHLFRAFQEEGRLGPLVALGAVALAGAVVSVAVLFALAGGYMRMMAEGGRFEAGAGVPEGLLLAALIVLAVQLAVAMALAYATPLVMLRGAPVGAALRSSFNACLRNTLPLLVFGLVYFFVALAASLPLMLGWVVLLPASVGMLYCSYKDIYESRESSAVSRQS